MNGKNTLSILFSVFLLLFAIPLFGGNIAGGHKGKITSLIHTGDYVISAGEDGFIGIWNISEKTAQERFQLTTYSIKLMVKHPVKDEICIIEEEDIDRCTISAWDYKKKKKMFSIPSTTPVTFINYSAKGNFIIAGGINSLNFSILDSLTGKIITSPELSGIPALAVTGAGERNMLVYQPKQEYSYDGLISYLNLSTAAETSRIQAPGMLSNPVIFGNNRFIAGINKDGLLLTDALTGEILDSMDDIDSGALLYPEKNEFHCINREEHSYVLYTFALDNNGHLITRRYVDLPVSGEIRIEAFASRMVSEGVSSHENITFAASDGSLYMLDNDDKFTIMSHNNQSLITEIAADENSIAFLTEDNFLCFLPLDYRLLENTEALTKELYRGYTQITSITTDMFVLWQNSSLARVPQIVYSNHHIDEFSLKYMVNRFPLRSISANNNMLLVLDSAGNLSVYDSFKTSNKPMFTFSSIGVIDALFINENYFIICRSAIGNNSPFLLVNYKTGETVPITFPAKGAITAGVTACSGKSGKIYAALIENDNDETKTKVISFSSIPSFRAENIFESPGEDIHLSMAESENVFAATTGTEAAIYSNNDAISFERTNGLTGKLISSGNFFIGLDSEGSIAWHDNKSGKTLAVFSLYNDKWILTTGTEEISGGLLQPQP